MNQLTTDRSTDPPASSCEPEFEMFRVVAPVHSARAHDIRDLLTRMNMPFGHYSASSPEGRQVLRESDLYQVRSPVVVRHDGKVLVDPTDAEIIEAFGDDRGAPPAPVPGGVCLTGLSVWRLLSWLRGRSER